MRAVVAAAFSKRFSLERYSIVYLSHFSTHMFQ